MRASFFISLLIGVFFKRKFSRVEREREEERGSRNNRKDHGVHAHFLAKADKDWGYR